MKLILGSGLSGLVGSRLVELLQNNYHFDNLDLNTGIDITQQQQVEQKIFCSKSNILVHLAAFTDVDKAWEERGNKKGKCYQINVLGTRYLAQACRKFNKYLIHISTDFVFDGRKNQPYVEEDKPCPLEWYGQTKYLAEEEVAKSGCRFVILRLAFPFKAKAAPLNLEPKPKVDFLRKIIASLKAGKVLKMYFDQIFTPTFIDDLVRVIEYCFLNQPEGIYHAVGSTFISPYDFASLVAEIFNFDKRLIKKASIKEFKTKNLRPRQAYLALSNQKLTREFKIKMLGVREALQTIKKQQEDLGAFAV